MNPISIGPLVFSQAQVLAFVAAAVLLIVSELTARLRPEHAKAIHWATTLTVVTWVVTARVGFVLANLSGFAASPRDVFAFWQGGFDPLAGICGVTVLLLVLLWRHQSTFAPLFAAVALAGTTAIAVGLMVPAPALRQLPEGLYASLVRGEPRPLATEGRPLVLNLWATWCPPCRREMPMMTEVAAAEQDVTFAFANQGESAATIRDFLTRLNLGTGAMVLDPEMNLMAELNMLGLPSTLFFSSDGHLQSVRTGEISRAALLAQIKDLKGVPNVH